MITLIFRKKNQGTSIEELFTDIKKAINNNGLKLKSTEVPCGSVNIGALVRNTIFVHNQKGILHVTGDIHYVAINPFRKMILTIHDIGSIIEGVKFNTLLKKIIWIWLPCFFVKRITVISDYSKNELLKCVPWAKSKVRVIYNPVNSQLIKKNKVFNKNCPVILHIGTKSNKNLENTIKGLAQIHCRLIIIGKLTNEQLNLLIEKKICYENYRNIPFSTIKQIYENCDIVSFISKYEGFGLPVIEAQKVGRVVITSNRAAIPEIAGKGAHIVNPEDINEIENGFQKLIDDDFYRENLINMGFNNVVRFDINIISKQYIALYKEIL